MEKIKPIEPITPTFFQNNSSQKSSKQFGQTILCSLFDSHICPNPGQCNGIDRKCAVWQSHSGK